MGRAVHSAVSVHLPQCRDPDGVLAHRPRGDGVPRAAAGRTHGRRGLRPYLQDERHQLDRALSRGQRDVRRAAAERPRRRPTRPICSSPRTAAWRMAARCMASPRSSRQPVPRIPRRPDCRRCRAQRYRRHHRHDALQAAARPIRPRCGRISTSAPTSTSRRSTISTARPAIRQITSRKLTDVVVHECWRGPATVELRPNAQAPVFRLPVVEPLEAFYWRADFTLVAGEIIHDYLATAPEAVAAGRYGWERGKLERQGQYRRHRRRLVGDAQPYPGAARQPQCRDRGGEPARRRGPRQGGRTAFPA